MAKQTKMKFKTPLTPISRLSKYVRAPQMVGDPKHGGNWDTRCKLVYAEEMRRRFPMEHKYHEELEEHLRAEAAFRKAAS